MIKLTYEFADLAALMAHLNGTTAAMPMIVGGGGGVLGQPTMVPQGIPPIAPASEPDEPATPVAVDPNDRDKNGLPWDARIHSGAGTKTATGEWRKRKGVDAALVTAVEAELRAKVATPAAPTMPAAAIAASPVPPTSPEPVAATIPTMPASAPAPVIPAAAPAPVGTASPSGVARVGQPVGGIDFGGLMKEISAAMVAQKLTDAKLAQLTAAFGVTTITEIAANLEQCAQAYNWLLQEGCLV